MHRVSTIVARPFTFNPAQAMGSLQSYPHAAQLAQPRFGFCPICAGLLAIGLGVKPGWGILQDAIAKKTLEKYYGKPLTTELLTRLSQLTEAQKKLVQSELVKNTENPQSPELMTLLGSDLAGRLQSAFLAK